MKTGLKYLSLRVVEVGRDSDDSIVDGGSEVRLSGLLHLGQNEGSHLEMN